MIEFVRRPNKGTTNKIMKVAKQPTLTEQDLLAAKKTLEANKRKQITLRDQELEIRAYIADCLHTGAEGSKTITVGGTKVSITRSISRSITREEAERLKQEHSDLYLECLSFRPEVRVAGYRSHTEILDDYISSKPGPATVEFK